MKRNLKKREKLSQKKVQELLAYDEDSAHFIWRPRPGWSNGINSFNTKYAGKRAGYVHRTGYRYIAFQGVGEFTETDIVWLYVYGCWPKCDIDHINGNTQDNRLANLREATRLENSGNRKINHNNKSGFPNVYRRNDNGRWRAAVRKDGKRINIGTFETPQEAYEAYLKTAKELRGEFLRS